MPAFLSPIGNDQIVDSNGAPLSGGRINTYLAGTSTPATTWTSITGLTAHANPIILNTLGLPNTSGSAIWLSAGVSYKFVITDSLGVLQRTIDNISGIGDNALSQDEWLVYNAPATYISPTSFSVLGDQTNIFQPGRRLKTTNTGGIAYSDIVSSLFLAGITTVTVLNTSGALDSGLSVVEYALLSATNPSVPAIYAKLNSPVFTGNPTAPTPAPGDNDTSIATTEFVQAITTQQTKQIQPVTASVASNAMTVTLNPTTLDFRSATLGSGVVNRRLVSTALNLVIPSTATMGTANALESRLLLLAIDNAGVVELAVANFGGSTNPNESGLISTTVMNAASDAVNVVYSQAARTNVPFRVVGEVVSTQAVAGTWVTAPSLIQGEGGNALAETLVLGAPIAATSGTAINVTGIPPWVKRVTVNLFGLSSSGSSPYTLQLGDSGGIETSGYNGAIVATGGSSVNTDTWATASGSASAVLTRTTTAPADIVHGVVMLTKHDATSWIISGNLAPENAVRVLVTTGSKVLSGVLDRLRITTLNGTDTFDAGSISVMWE